MRTIGTFKLSSREMMISDPYYMDGSYTQKVLKPVRPGEWVVHIDGKGISAEGNPSEDSVIQRLKACHEDHVGQAVEEVIEGDFFIDSGQVGIFDMAHYRSIKIAEPVPEPKYEITEGKDGTKGHVEWINMVHYRTEHIPYAGIIPYGSVARMGGKGMKYTCRVGRNKQGEIVAIILTLL